MSASAPPQTVTPQIEELAPGPDPWEVARKLAHLPHLLFLDSAERHPERGRYSYVTADPVALIVRSVGDLARHDPFDDGWFDYPRIERPRGIELPPFLGGWAGLLGYGLGRAFDRQPLPRTDEFEAPVLALGVYDWVIAFDHEADRAWLVSTGQDHGQTFASQREAAIFRADIVKKCLAGRDISWYLGEGERRWPDQPIDQPGCACPTPQHPLPGFHGVTSNFSRDGYLAAVRRAIEYTHAGDCFQVNLSQRLLAPLTVHPLELYGRLRKTNPAPFACYFDAGDFQIVSASPERFLQVSPNGEVVTKPIKGTRPRGKTPNEDAANVRDLITSPKDRAENVMIVDLLRNDLGRVCEYGSVTVPKVCEVESYRDVHHLVSEVRGKLRPGMTPFDLLRAAFPGGSVTGAPKVRAMEIIAELESTARGPYCGSVGFVGFDGSMDTNILIRTFTAGRGWLQFPVGGGIVADSDPEREYEETLHKAAGLLRALQK
jgi:para-aminobenzoate synthetase component 1